MSGETSPTNIAGEGASASVLTADQEAYFENRGGDDGVSDAPDPVVDTVAKGDDPAPEVAPPPAAEPTLVPKQALDEARARLKEQRDLAERQSKTLDSFGEILKRLDKVQAPPQVEAAPQPPDLNQDPLAYIQWQNERIARMEQAEAARQQHAQMSAQTNDLVSRAQMSEREFAARTPDYGDAVAFVKSQAMAEYAVLGIPEAQREAAWNQQVLAMAQRTIQTGGNIGDVTYAIARARGFASKPAAPPPAATPAPSAVAASRAASQSLSGAGGSPPGDDGMTLEKLGSLRGAAFEKAFAKWGKQLMQ
jgi:hypothetical protein